MPRRKYMSCLKTDDDDFDGGYSRLENGSAGDGDDNICLGESERRGRRTEDDYFRSPNSYQFNQADNDQGQEPMVVEQGSHNYTGVQIESKKHKKKMGKRTVGKRIRHFIRVSFKWMRRGFFAMSPATTPQMVMNPAVVMSSAMGRHVSGTNKSMVYL